MKRVCLTALAWLSLTAALSAQIMNGNVLPEEPAKPVTPGELSPYFWIGAQMVAVLGKNFETGASGISYSNNQTWVSFNVSLLDSHYDTPKKIVSTDDPNHWSMSFALVDPTSRINNYSSTPELNLPAWSLGLAGYGWRFGYKYEATQPLGLNPGGDPGASGQNVPPATSTTNLMGANEVLYLGTANAATTDYLTDLDSVVRVSYPVTDAAFASYAVPDLYAISVTAGSRGDVTKAKTSDGYAGAANFTLTPMGPGSYDEPLTYTVKGDVIAGSGYDTTGNPVGFGVQSQVDYYLDDDVFVSPLAAFDGRVNDTWTSGFVPNADAYHFEWRAGGGVLLTLSPKRWVTDLYQEVPAQTSTGWQNAENAHIQKFTYVQAMFDYSRPAIASPRRDLNFILKAEEPDGIVGFDDNWGGMVEFRAANLLQANTGTTMKWSSIWRASYELVQHTVMPYVQGYLDSDKLAKLRFGVQMEPVKGTAVEITYMTTNLTGVSTAAKDGGRLEVLLALATDPAFRLIKTMNFSYTGQE